MTDYARLEQRLLLEIKYCKWPEQANLLREAVDAITQLRAKVAAAEQRGADDMRDALQGDGYEEQR